MGKFIAYEGIDVLGSVSNNNTITGSLFIAGNLSATGNITGSTLRIDNLLEHSSANTLAPDLKILAAETNGRVHFIDYDKVISYGGVETEIVDSNTGTSPLYETIINDTSTITLKEINGRILRVDQDNSTTGTLRFGLGNWNGDGSTEPSSGNRYTYGSHFTVEIINTGQYKFRLGFYVPSLAPAYWDFHWVGNDSGGGAVYRVDQPNATQGAATVYSTDAAKYIGPASRTRVTYDYTGRVIVHCTNWTT